MATIDQAFRLTKFRASKSGYAGTISSNDFNLIFPQAELRYYLKLFGNQNQYQVNNPAPPISYPGTLKVSTSLTKFKSGPQAITIDNTGRYTKPSDLYFIDSLRHTVASTSLPTPITRVEEQDLAGHLASNYEAPTELFPIYVEYQTYIQFYPITLATATLSYLKAPTKSFWNYTLNGSIAGTNTLVGGSGYVNGIYPNVPLTGGSGNGAFATITVSGTAVTAVQITSGGFAYKSADILSASNAYLGGAGTGFSVTVAQLINTREVYSSSGSTDPLWADFDLDEIIYMTLSDMGVFLKDSELEAFALANSKTGGV